MGCGRTTMNKYQKSYGLFLSIYTLPPAAPSLLKVDWQMLQALINPAIMLTTSRNRTEWNLNGNIKTWIMDGQQLEKKKLGNNHQLPKALRCAIHNVIKYNK